jgi:uncharacterized protein YrrD
MLRNAKSLEGFELHATDGVLGQVKDFYFDDQHWIVRYFVVSTGRWLSGRWVLISPTAVHRPEWKEHQLPVDLTMDQVRNSPAVNVEQPVTAEDEWLLTHYYSWPTYWDGSRMTYTDGFNGMGFPPPLMPEPAVERLRRQRVDHSAVAEHHLRSVRKVRGYTLEAADGAIGHIDDFLFDEIHWDIRYLVVDTGKWLSSRKVLLAPNWIRSIGWDASNVTVDLTREAIEASPVYDPNDPFTTEYFGRLHDHYGRPRAEER